MPKSGARSKNKANAKNIKNPNDLAKALARKHKRGDLVLGKQALLTVATVLDKKATDGQVRVMVREADKAGLKLGFKPRCIKKPVAKKK